MLLTVYLLQDVMGCYFMNDGVLHDDYKYIYGAQTYADSAQSFVDWQAFILAMGEIGHSVELNDENGWFLFASLFMYIFNNEWLFRLMNIIFAGISVILIYKLAIRIYDEQVALKSAKILAFLPYPILFCCFPFKDQFIMMLLLSFLILAYDLATIKGHSFTRIITMLFLILVIHFTRQGLDVLLLLFTITYYYFKRIYNSYSSIIWFFCIFIIIIIFFGKDLYEDVTYKLNTYITNRDYSGSRILSLIAIEKIYDIWKFPLSLAFALLLPFDLNQKWNTWYGIISSINIMMLPFAISNVLFLFMKKKEFILYWILMAFYFAVIVMSATIFRHYYCLLPISIIFFSKCWLTISNSMKKNIYAASFILSIFLFLIYRVL